jgi:hypothetical protein
MAKTKPNAIASAAAALATRRRRMPKSNASRRGDGQIETRSFNSTSER